MRIGKSFSLSLSSFPPWNVDQDHSEQQDDMQGEAPSTRSSSLDPSKGEEGAAKLAAEAVSKAESVSGCQLDPFVPNSYTAQLDWHQGPRAALSRLFPRYGHYCGPNYSSGRDAGPLTWDQAPIDHLDYCCYRHDMAYDSHDQSILLEADVQLLKCLNSRPRKDDGKKVELVYPWGEAYELAAKHGLKHLLIPYRSVLVRLRGKKKEDKRQRIARQRQEDERRPSLQ